MKSISVVLSKGKKKYPFPADITWVIDIALLVSFAFLWTKEKKSLISWSFQVTYKIRNRNLTLLGLTMINWVPIHTTIFHFFFQHSACGRDFGIIKFNHLSGRIILQVDGGESDASSWWQRNCTSTTAKWKSVSSINSSVTVHHHLLHPFLDLYSAHLFAMEKGFERKMWSNSWEAPVHSSYYCKFVWAETFRCPVQHHQQVLFQSSNSSLVYQTCHNCN